MFATPSARVVRRLVVALVALLLPLAAWAETVYVTKTGARYHLASCRHLTASARPVALADALKTHTPCKVCAPPSAVSPKGSKSATARGLVETPPPAAARRVQCRATTKKGARCLRNARSGEAFCWQHA